MCSSLSSRSAPASLPAMRLWSPHLVKVHISWPRFSSHHSWRDGRSALASASRRERATFVSHSSWAHCRASHRSQWWPWCPSTSSHRASLLRWCSRSSYWRPTPFCFASSRRCSTASDSSQALGLSDSQVVVATSPRQVPCDIYRAQEVATMGDATLLGGILGGSGTHVVQIVIAIVV